ncbi:MAG TPA: chemotaxis protein CheW [Labilithrix sp.]|nr:chemotaxis protein CheW [Labilithrix sp.]
MSTQVCTFILGDYLFGIEVKNIQEVIRYQQMTPVPLAPSTIRGLINLRGQIVSAIDMRARLGLPARENAEPINVVVCTDDGVVSLLVDDVGDVVDVDDDTFERAPETMSGAFRELVTGIYKLDRLLLLLDVERVAYDAPTARLKEIS